MGAVEGAIFAKKKVLVDLSEQEAVDCVMTVSGCEGGATSAGKNNVQINF